MSSKIVRMRGWFGRGGSGGSARSRCAVPSTPIFSVVGTALALVGAILALAVFLSAGYKVQSPKSPGFAAPVSTNSSGSVYYRETGHYLKDAFLNYWLMNGGVAIYGYPISEEFDSDGVRVQYFEKSRFEYNPASGNSWKVDLTPVGSLLTEGREFPTAAQTGSTPDQVYFDQTGHTLGGVFFQYWQASGGD